MPDRYARVNLVEIEDAAPALVSGLPSPGSPSGAAPSLADR